MSKELRYLIDQLSFEKGISKETLRSNLESAILSAVKKRFSDSDNITLSVSPDNYEITACRIKSVVEKVQDDGNEISLKDAVEISKEAQVGEELNIPIDIKEFGRIAAQTAKQVLFQKVREAEREVIYDEFISKVDTIISGTVQRKERGAYIVGIGKAEACLPIKETIHGEHLKTGDTVRAYIESVNTTSKGPQILLTRANTSFVAALFKMEVPEINDGIVEIRNIVREAGDRTKMSVISNDSSIDPVGACVGMKGTRVQSIVRELRGERIDIIHWSDDPRHYIAAALTPATIDKLGINEEDRTAMVVADDQQLSIAIGKKGQNVRLAMKLTGWEIDIISETRYSEIRQENIDISLDQTSSDEE